MTLFIVWTILAALVIIVGCVLRRIEPIFLLPAFVVASVFALILKPEAMSCIPFGILLVLGIILLFFYKRKIGTNSYVDIESAVGQTCVVIEKIDGHAGCGEVKVNGQIWSARSAFEEDTFEVGETLAVVAIEGVKLICRRI